MSGGLISLAALRTARMLKENASPQQIEAYIAQMMGLARRHDDAGRETFWREVAALVERATLPLRQSEERRRSGTGRG